ncbi:MAG: hypothetical protein HOK50_06460 [Kordiimonadaceae bacterium]|nr:hypothetical protein [Kordiimonadaceae bacterium]
MQCIYQAAKALETGAFGAKNQSASRINITFLILPDQEGCFREYIFDQLLILQMS